MLTTHLIGNKGIPITMSKEIETLMGKSQKVV